MKYTIQDLKEAVLQHDNEEAHSIFDELIMEIAERSEPSKVERLKNIVGDMTFWYA